MKNMVVNLMVSVMTLMKPFVWCAVAVAVIGIGMTLSKLAFKGTPQIFFSAAWVPVPC